MIVEVGAVTDHPSSLQPRPTELNFDEQTAPGPQKRLAREQAMLAQTDQISFTYLDVLPDGIDDNWPGLCVNSHETSQSRIKFILWRLKKK